MCIQIRCRVKWASVGLLLAIVALGTPEKASADFVINDDLIVDGSAAIGFDAVNGENFGFDTLRLKENNLRIHFDDTSNSASFPRNDWRIVINDTTNGGDSFFRIEDTTGARNPFTIQAGARSNALFVRNNGNIGFGTATPVVNLHVVSGNTPTLRLEQDGSSGFTPQIWDVAGNEANFFIRDVTGGSKLFFRARPGAPQDSMHIQANGDVVLGASTAQGKFHVENTGGNDTDDFVVLSNGNVGIGTTAPGQKLQIQGTGTIVQTIRSDTATTGRAIQQYAVDSKLWDLGNNTNATNLGSFVLREDGATRLTILAGGNVGIGTTTPGGLLDVNGAIFQRGASLHPDFVFEKDYELESIEDHAAYMWKNKHLPAVGPGKNDELGRAIIDLGGKTLGTLEELEKAHIYIEQLNNRIKAEEARNAELAERISQLESKFQSENGDAN